MTARPGPGPPLPVAAIALGLSGWIFVPVVGRLSLLEVAALALAPPVLLGLLADRLGRRVLLAGGLWVVGIAVSAVVLRPPALPVLLQAATAVFLLAGVALVRYVLRTDRDRAALVAAFGAGQLVGLVVTPPQAAVVNGVWKFAAGQAVTVLVLAALDRYGRLGRGLAPVVLVLLAGLHLVLGSRGLALFSLVTLAGLLAAPGRGRRPRSRLALLVAGSVAGGLVLQAAYVQLAAGGRLGPGEQLKVALQTGDLGLLVGARKDAVFLVTAIAERPVLGWGPTAPATVEVKTTAARWLVDHGYVLEHYDHVTLLLPDVLYLHSVLLGAWVTAGLPALPFWLLALVLLARATLRAMGERRLAESFLLVVAVWHVFFSPMGDVTRVHLAVLLGLALSVLSRPAADPAEPGGQQHGEAGGHRDLPGRAADRPA